MTAAKITHQNVTVNTKDGPMNIYIALPPQPASQSPALIILQEAFGVNHHIKDVCHRFAKEGYIAVAPELFHRSGQNLELPYGDFSKVLPILGQLTNDKLLEDMTATFNYLKGLSQVSSIGTIGYCMGGFCAVLAACRLPLKVAVSYYGGGMTKTRPGFGFSPFLEQFPHISCPVFLAYGEEDHGIPKEDRDLVSQKLKEAKIDYEMHVYPHAGHAFFCEDRPAFHPEAAAAAWRETLQWLKRKML